ncbi:MAG: hypothetical protein J6Q52_01935 [Clostridia bacterium]|nr:hypothetical protein [Clostridia bacterium]
MASIEFYEQILSKNFGKNKKIAFIMGIASFLLLGIGIMIFMVGITMENVGLLAIIGGIMLVIGGFLALRKDYVNCDYEYEFIQGDMDISRVLNNSKRSSLLKFNVSDVVVIGKTTQKNYIRYQTMPSYKKIYACLSRKPADDIYFLVVKNHLLHFSPNADLLSAMKKYLRVRIGD